MKIKITLPTSLEVRLKKKGIDTPAKLRKLIYEVLDKDLSHHVF